MESAELRANLEKHHRESYGWALACCAHKHTEAESVLQTVYLKVLEGKARFDGHAAFKTWLFAVIRRTAADKRRRHWWRGFAEVKEENPERRFSAEHLDEAVYRSEVQRLFRDALAQLPQRQREVLHLVFYYDLSLAESAEILSISLGSVRTHYERGKQRLRELMKGVNNSDERIPGRSEDTRTVSATETR